MEDGYPFKIKVTLKVGESIQKKTAKNAVKM